MPRLYLIEQSALVIGGHYHAYTQTVAKAAIDAGLDVTILHNHRLRGDWGVPQATSIPAFKHTWSEAEGLWIRNWEPGNIAYDFRQAVRKQPPKAGDHILFATLGYAEMTALLEYLGRLPAGSDNPFYHILLRYDPDVLRSNLPLFRPLFDRITQSPMLRRCIAFHTDTDLLSAEFAELTGAQFNTLPIPFQQQHLRKELKKDRRPSKPLVIGYLGDARLEKNFNDLPNAISYLWKDYVAPGKARFVLQSNFNVDGGEPGILKSVQRLGQFLPEQVELLASPLDGDAYYDRLLAADIMMVPYDPVRYRYRSSGILIEAMAAAKPLVTTRHSWMETQVHDDHAIVYEGGAELGPALARMIDNYASYRKAAITRAPDILEWSSGRNFVDSLIRSVVGRVKAPSTAPRVLLVIEGDTLVQRNGAGQVAMTQLRYLNDAGYRVCAIFLMNKKHIDVFGVENWTEQLNARIAEFDIEAAFLVGTGRLSFDVLRQRMVRDSEESSIISNQDQVRSFDTSLDLIRYISQTSFDLAWVNYVVNKPVLEMLGIENIPTLCETHDIQSFQKAIYGYRRVDQTELSSEIEDLKSFSHLISLSGSETAYLTQYIASDRITTTGIFPPVAKPTSDMLAGVLDLAELIGECVPTHTELLDRNSEALSGLLGLETIDLLYVSSNHLANVSGLRWFLDEIYLPVLAPMGISMVIAGSIREAADWPQSPRLFFLGRLGDLAPLYAAAKVVVLPVLEGAGIAVKTFEAISYGRPIVATREALRGMDADYDGVIVADNASEFACAVSELLGSQPLRLARANAVRRTATKLADPSRYSALLNKTFHALLGNRAIPVSRTATPPIATNTLLEWDEILRACNRLLRNWLQHEPLHEHALRRLAFYPEAEIEPILRQLGDALIVRRSARILGNIHAPKVAEDDAHAMRIEQLVQTLMSSIAIYASDERVTDARARPSIVFARSWPLTMWTFTEDDKPASLEFEKKKFSFDQTTVANLRIANLDARPTRRSKRVEPLGLVTLLKAQAESPWVASQQFGLQILSTTEGVSKVVASTNESPLQLFAGMRFDLHLPPLFTVATRSNWLDIIVDTDVSLEIRELGVLLPLNISSFNGQQMIRCELPPAHYAIRPVDRLLAITVTSGAGRLMQLINRLVSTRDEGALLDIISDWEESSASLTSADDNGPSVKNRLLQQSVVAIQNGKAIRRMRALALRDQLMQANYGRPLSDVIDGTGLSKGLGGLLNANLVDPEHGRSIVASPGLTVEIYTADGANEQTSCLIDGRNGKQVIDRDGHANWIIEGKHDIRAQHWIRSVNLSSADGSHLSGEQIYYLPQGRDQKTGDRHIILQNFYGIEQDGDLAWSWTGPQSPATIVLPLATRSSGTLRIGFITLGINEFAQFRVVMNGVDLAIEISREGDDLVAVGNFDADPDNLGVTEIELHLAQHFRPGGDPRTLGMRLKYVELRIPLD